MTQKKSGGQQTAHIRLARFRERQADRGLKRVEVVVPEARADEIREIAAKMRQDNTMNENASMIARLDAEIEKNAEQQREIWRNAGRDEYGEPKLSSAQKKRMKTLVEERRSLEESANAAYRL